VIKVYGIKNCDSVRKALKHLKSHALKFKFIDFRETPVSDREISQWLKYTDINTLFNTRGTTYRTLKLKELNLDNEGKVWLTKENMLIKRPVITVNNNVIVGYNENLYSEKLQ